MIQEKTILEKIIVLMNLYVPVRERVWKNAIVDYCVEVLEQLRLEEGIIDNDPVESKKLLDEIQDQENKEE